MTGMRIMSRLDGLEREIYPGDLAIWGEAIYQGLVSQTAAAFNISAQTLVNSLTVVKSTAALGAATGTLDSATNILAAIAGNQAPSDLVPGSTFRFEIQNQLTGALTIAVGSGVQVGTLNSGNTLSVSAGFTREYVATVNNNQPACAFNMTYTSGSVLSFVLPPNATALSINSRDYGNFPTPGMVITNAPTGLTASGITVTGLVQGQGGITGVSVSTVPTTASAAAGTQVQFCPQIIIDTVGQRNN